jgi:hypothetical protein
MYSIKPGRGPSMMGAIIGLVIGVPFVLFWIGGASRIGAPPFFVFFGIAFLVVLLINVAMGFYNGMAKNRISQMDITTSAEEPDPLNRVAQAPPNAQPPLPGESRFCPFCGRVLEQEFKFCPACGKAAPK